MIRENEFMISFSTWVQDFQMFVQQKGKVEPNKYRAYGFKPPKHKWANVKDGIRYFKMMVGKAPKGSSPRIQQDLDLNRMLSGKQKKVKVKN